MIHIHSTPGIMSELEVGPFRQLRLRRRACSDSGMGATRTSLFFYHPYQRVFSTSVQNSQIATSLVRASYNEAREAGIILPPSVKLALKLMQGSKLPKSLATTLLITTDVLFSGSYHGDKATSDAERNRHVSELLLYSIIIV